MERSLAVFVIATAVLGPGGAQGQEVRARSADYEFLSTADDARAIWVNPAGPGTTIAASLMAEFVIDRATTGSARLGQWTAGLTSRGISIAYKRDRIPDADANDALRLGAALPFQRGAVGAAFTLHRGPPGTQRALDLGLRLRPIPRVDLGLVIQNIGRPAVRAEQLPVAAGIGASWLTRPPNTILQVAGEARFTERLAASGLDVTYRIGGTLTTRTAIPIGAIAAFDLGTGLGIDHWAVGLSVGGMNRGVFVTSGQGSDGVNLERMSLTGIAAQRPGRRR